MTRVSWPMISALFAGAFCWMAIVGVASRMWR